MKYDDYLLGKNIEEYFDMTYLSDVTNTLRSGYDSIDSDVAVSLLNKEYWNEINKYNKSLKGDFSKGEDLTDEDLELIKKRSKIYKGPKTKVNIDELIDWSQFNDEATINPFEMGEESEGLLEYMLTREDKQ